MPAPLRIAYPGAYYHIIARGNNKSDLFSDTGDRLKYLERLNASIAEYNVRVYAYALMTNHVHLFVKTKLANISDWMFNLTLGYTKYFNLKYLRTGHLFETRFKSRLVQKDRYFLALLRYIHTNPVKAAIAAKPEDYEWSSHRAYLVGGDSVVEDPWETLALFSENRENALQQYIAFINQDIPPKEWNALDRIRNGFLGDRQFCQFLSKR